MATGSLARPPATTYLILGLPPVSSLLVALMRHAAIRARREQIQEVANFSKHLLIMSSHHELLPACEAHNPRETHVSCWALKWIKPQKQGETISLISPQIGFPCPAVEQRSALCNQCACIFSAPKWAPFANLVLQNSQMSSSSILTSSFAPRSKIY